MAERWDLIEMDFQSVYGIDLSGWVLGPDGPVRLLKARTSRWLLWRVHGLISERSSRFAAHTEKAENGPERNAETPDDEDEVIV